METLQREVFPSRSAIVGMRDRGFVVVIENLSRNEHNQNRSVLSPRFVRIDEQIEKKMSASVPWHGGHIARAIAER